MHLFRQLISGARSAATVQYAKCSRESRLDRGISAEQGGLWVDWDHKDWTIELLFFKHLCHLTNERRDAQSIWASESRWYKKQIQEASVYIFSPLKVTTKSANIMFLQMD